MSPFESTDDQSGGVARKPVNMCHNDKGSPRLRSVAFYLPQYHRIPENDAWWGEGFTDWVNVRRARPRFAGHGQPDLPTVLGFYDLMDPGIREAQAELARRYSIDAFCYYHYWFGGRRLLHSPLDEMLRSGKPEFPFCLCWANEPWTGSWDGGAGGVLIDQSYSEADDRRHGQWLAQVFADPRYLRIDGRPVMLVYRASHHPDIARALRLWAEEVVSAGLPSPFCCRVESFSDECGDPRPLGFDAAVAFRAGNRRIRGITVQAVLAAVWKSFGRSPDHFRFDYRRAVRHALREAVPSYPRFPCVMPGWDNTPRRASDAVVVHDADPDTYGTWVREEGRKALAARSGETLLFVNAWNEWAEGAHLEPGERFGMAFLEAHREAMLPFGEERC